MRRLLFRWLLAPLGILLVLAAAVAYPLALYPATAAYDWALMDTAFSLSRLIGETPPGNPISVGHSAEILLRTDQYDRIYYSVHDLDGRLLAGDSQLFPPDPHLFRDGELLFDRHTHGEWLRVAALRTHVNGAEVVVQVAETGVKREKLIARILTGMVATEVLVVIIALLLVWFGIAKGMAPLQRLRAELEARSPHDLRPVEQAHAPVELQPVVQALNDLLRRLGAALQAQQRFVANVAHQLRTPLAGLRMHVQNALQGDPPPEWKQTLQPLNSATERATHLVNQLLVLARAEAKPIQPHEVTTVDLASVVQDVVAQCMPRAISKNIDVGLELQPARICGDHVLISELLSNLIDNAITYLQSGGRITVRTWSDPRDAVVEVEDNGVGIPIEERRNVFQRFYRLQQSGGDGCGLGLAIVQEIAHSHGGEATIGTPPGGRGAVVLARFPAYETTETGTRQPV